MTFYIRQQFAATYSDSAHRGMSSDWRGRQAWTEVRGRLAISLAYDVAYDVTPDPDEVQLFLRVDRLLNCRFARVAESTS